MNRLRDLSGQQRLGLVIVAVSFAASAGATIDYALELGIHPWTSWALPVSLELSIVLSALVWHTASHKVVLARVVFWSAVVVTWMVNFAHAGFGVAGVLAAMPTLSLPAGLHLAFELPRRRQRAPRARSRPPARMKPPPASSNGHAPALRKTTPAELAKQFPSAEAVTAFLEQYQAEHPGATQADAWASVGATLNQGNRLRRRYREAAQ